MANRFWVGGTGNFNDTAHWSTTSGGASGAAVPTSADSALFDANSFSAANQIVTIPNGYGAQVLTVDFTGATNSPNLQFAGTGVSGSSLKVFGTLFRLISSMSVTFSGTGNKRNSSLFLASSTTLTLDTKNVNIPIDIEIQGNTTLASNFSGGLFQALTTATTFDTAGFILTVGTLNLDKCTFLSRASTITLQGFTDTDGRILNGAIFNSSSLTWTDGGSVMQFSYAANSGNFNFYDLQFNGQTIGDITFSGTATSTNPYTIGWGVTATGAVGKWTASAGEWFQFDSSWTLTIGNFNVNGAAGNLVTFRSDSTPNQYTFSSNTVSVSYIDVKDSIASGATPFLDTNGTDSGNNVNWSFSKPAQTAAWLAFFLQQ